MLDDFGEANKANVTEQLDEQAKIIAETMGLDSVIIMATSAEEGQSKFYRGKNCDYYTERGMTHYSLARLRNASGMIEVYLEDNEIEDD